MTDPSADAHPHASPADAAGGFLPRDMLTPALRSDPESFPVLKAFQEYIEAERERARRRLLTVSATAIAAIVLIVGAFLGVGASVVGRMMNENKELQQAVIAAAIRDREVAPAAVATSSRTDDISRMDETVRRLQAENVAFQGRMAALQDLPTALAATMGQTFSNLVGRTPTASAGPSGSRALSTSPTSPFAPPSLPTEATSVAVSVPTSARQATAPATDPEPVAKVPAPTAVAASLSGGRKPTSEAPTAVSISARVQTAPRIDGYAPARLTLVTDRGVAIPWRIVVPE